MGEINKVQTAVKFGKFFSFQGQTPRSKVAKNELLWFDTCCSLPLFLEPQLAFPHMKLNTLAFTSALLTSAVFRQLS